jgi:hypothetical protein
MPVKGASVHRLSILRVSDGGQSPISLTFAKTSQNEPIKAPSYRVFSPHHAFLWREKDGNVYFCPPKSPFWPSKAWAGDGNNTKFDEKQVALG